MTVQEFQGKYKTKEEREKVLRIMSDREIKNIINSIDSVTGKLYYSKFLKQKKA